MPRVVRLSDSSDHGGVVITGSLNVIVEGQPVARTNDLHACPVPGHGVTKIIGTGPQTFANGRQFAVHGDKAKCGASLQAGAVLTYCGTGGGMPQVSQAIEDAYQNGEIDEETYNSAMQAIEDNE